MKISDLVDALKAFFFDVLGFLIPGFYCILILSFLVLPQYKFEFDYGGLNKEWNSSILVIISYILGYCLYPLSDWSDKIIFRFKFLKLKTQSQVESDIDSSTELAICKVALTELLLKNDSTPVIPAVALDNMSARNLRSIIMSYIPEVDTKIYTFMFRSELCRLISSFTLFISLLGLLLSIVNNIVISKILLKSDFKSIAVYSLLLLSCYFLTKARMRFLSIAYKIPFSIFIAKYFKIT